MSPGYRPKALIFTEVGSRVGGGRGRNGALTPASVLVPPQRGIPEACSQSPLHMRGRGRGFGCRLASSEGWRLQGAPRVYPGIVLS